MTHERSAARFALLAFGWTWAFWVPAAAGGGDLTSFPTSLLFLAGGAGPLLAAITAARLEGAGAGRDLWIRMRDRRRVRGRWLIAIAALATLPYLAARPFGSGGGSGELAVGLLLIGVIAGVAEEPGWRGYAQDRLQRSWHPAVASLVVGVAWALWHAPLFFIEGSYHHDDVGLDAGAAVYGLQVVALSLVYGAIYVATDRSILAVVVFHALQNAAGEALSAPDAEVAELVVLAAIAAGLWMVLGRRQRTHTGVPIGSEPDAHR